MYSPEVTQASNFVQGVDTAFLVILGISQEILPIVMLRQIPIPLLEPSTIPSLLLAAHLP